jgi:menaquinone-specific isochorismate synthase
MIEKLHPTPALGAFPKKDGRTWLLDYENRGVPRMRLGAPFGAISSQGFCRTVVAIRNLQWKNSTLWIGAGCGIINQSLVDREWQEILGKIRSVKKLFGLPQ